MGVDIYLESIWKPFEAELERKPVRSGPVTEASVMDCFDELRASGGYFRNGYNSGDVMWAMGLGWRAVSGMLDEHRYLPVQSARDLVKMVEARPLTREHVAAHVFGDMCNDHPVTGWLHKMMDGVAAEHGQQSPDPRRMPTQEEIDNLHAFLNTRRDQLLAILRKSIELDEPLLVSL